MEPDSAHGSPASELRASGSEAGYLPERLIDQIDGTGPVLICVGGLHGNEPGGMLALERVCRSLRKDPGAMTGTLVALRGNRPALMLGRRAVERDLNRVWSHQDLDRLSVQGSEHDDGTDRELRDLWQIMLGWKASGRPLFLLDLHSTSGKGPPFAVVLGSDRSEALASRVGVPCVHGLNESIRGTLAAWFANELGASMVIEGGQSGQPETVRHLESAVYSGLAATGLLPEQDDRVRHSRQILAQASESLPTHVRVFHREATEDLGFAMGEARTRRFQSFDFVRKGERLAQNRLGPIEAPRDGYLIMPLYQAQGSEGYFLAEPFADPAAAPRA
ncbi:MAG: succinylglutamate desuccinylase/aspartoacylase family protein [Planctomycetes bacterium]|nr:succinylglutamate desuccinylase/aspartoacylase family protein [Planctomycetota bacterium]MCB9909517.1 succinylglutamate desuccinylase/aspartoacylase family protein [Planctomycetota bacterium]MCB9912516.1 succinylglutamate desuccinylase/aspartoacylase family protein [Planctomycetota bacterium]HPF14963.1 succinylglutamate desuccinylase/aspartoacylase family protein [Planctomycetota bacterium]